MTLICAECGKELTREQVRKGRKCCSYRCRGMARRKRVQKVCPVCKKNFELIQSRAHRACCSPRCGYIFVSGEKHPRWKGGKPQKDAPRIKVNGKKVYVHRIIMAEHIGRDLLPSEVVHHINGDNQDNRVENLRLYANTGEHTRYHALNPEAGR